MPSVVDKEIESMPVVGVGVSPIFLSHPELCIKIDLGQLADWGESDE